MSRAAEYFAAGQPAFRVDADTGMTGLEQLIITDLGSHTLDLARFLFGEAKSIYCRKAESPSLNSHSSTLNFLVSL